MRNRVTMNMCRFLQKPKLSFLALGYILFFQLLPHSALSNSKDFDQILIYVRASKIGGSDIPGLIDGQTLYLSVSDFFDFLKIKSSPLSDGIMEGHVLDQTDKYQINLTNNSITYKESTYFLPTSAMQEMDGLVFLHSDSFGEVFDLYTQFDYRNLEVTLHTDLDLPIYKQLRQDLMRKSMNNRQVENADTVLRPKYSILKFGGLDWDFSMNKWVGLTQGEKEQTMNSSVPTRGSLNIGGELGYGDFQARINWFDNSKLDYRNIDFRWNKVLTTQNVLRQITLGRLNGSSFSSIFQPITGIRLTNAPPVARKEFGVHTIRDFTHPFWIVELYLNNQLVDFVKTDETGLYLFEFPLNYGTNTLSLRFFGPTGEEEVQEESLFVPFILLPKKELIYTIHAGLVHDLKYEKIANVQVDYGLTKTFTLGAGIEYYSGLGDRLFIPRFTTSSKLGKNMMLSSEWLPGQKLSGVWNTRTKSGITLDLSFENLQEGQTAFPQLNYLSLRRFSASIPFKTKRKPYTSRINLTEFVYPNSKIQSLQWSVFGELFGTFSNFSTYVSRFNHEIFLTSTLQQTYMLPAGWRLNARAQVNYQRMDFSNLMIGLEKPLSRNLRMTSFYQTNFNFKNTLLGLSLKFDLGIFQGATNSRIQGDQLLINQSLMGSVVHDQIDKNLTFSSRSELGRSTLILLPYLDLNDNGVKDKEESYEFDLAAKVKGASVSKDQNSGVTRIKNLIPYQQYLIELDENSLADISWRLDHKKIQVTIKPGGANELEIPIKVVNEIEGKVLLNNELIGGIKIQFYNQQNQLIKEVISQHDGTFFFSDLKAGNYTFQPDTTQLNELGMVWDSKKQEIQFDPGSQGGYSSGWVVELSKKEDEKLLGGADETSPEDFVPGDLPGVRKAKPTESIPDLRSREIGDIPVSGTLGDQTTKQKHGVVYRIQVQASRVMLDAFQLSRLPDSVQHRKENGWHKYYTGSFDSFMQAEQALQRSISVVYKDAFVVYQFTGESPFFSHFPGEYSVPDSNENYFKVQIFASKKPISAGNSPFNLLTLEEEMHQGLHKYMTGGRMTMQDAQALRSKCVTLGFADAMIVEFSGGKRLVKY